ncbi:hypothetical protein [Mailhella massiliensis]|uniref:hypothetical protein n=1 Tax=Mailhella massiliensis TaxID=1903261 RepID=UPI0023537A82|nr:hypothetical protein [Mailhella massiliensis]
MTTRFMDVPHGCPGCASSPVMMVAVPLLGGMAAAWREEAANLAAPEQLPAERGTAVFPHAASFAEKTAWSMAEMPDCTHPVPALYTPLLAATSAHGYAEGQGLFPGRRYGNQARGRGKGAPERTGEKGKRLF